MELFCVCLAHYNFLSMMCKTINNLSSVTRRPSSMHDYAIVVMLHRKGIRTRILFSVCYFDSRSLTILDLIVFFFSLRFESGECYIFVTIDA